jgi:hypothetical protein
MVHELGHLIFGLPDLYDTDFSSSGFGGFGVMGYGTWGRDVVADTHRGDTPVLPTAWTQLQLPWVTARAGGALTSAGRDTVPATAPYVGRATVAISQSSGFWACSAYEYFLMQYRTNVGYDRGLNEFLDPFFETFDAGVIIYHVDESRNNNTQDSRRLVDVEEANGIAMGLGSGVNTNLWYQGHATLFNSTTTPSSDANNRTNSEAEVEVLNAWVTSTGDAAVNMRIASVCDVPPFTVGGTMPFP